MQIDFTDKVPEFPGFYLLWERSSFISLVNVSISVDPDDPYFVGKAKFEGGETIKIPQDTEGMKWVGPYQIGEV